jgi:predicted esterase
MLLGCHERDPHIPLARVRETAVIFERLGAAVTAEILPGSGHGVTEPELGAVRTLLEAAASRP